MPRHLICDAHEWINEILTVSTHHLAKPQPRERAWKRKRGKKTLLSLTLVCFCEKTLEVLRKEELYGELETLLLRTSFYFGCKMILKGWKFFYYLNSLYFNYIQQSITQQKQVGSLTGAVHLRKNSAGEPRRAQWEEKSHVELKGKSPLDLVFQCENKRGNCVLSILYVLRRTSA